MNRQTLAQLFSQLSDDIDTFRIAQKRTYRPIRLLPWTTLPEAWSDLSAQFIGQNVANTLANVPVDADGIVAAVKAAQRAMKVINDAGKVISIATAAVTLGTAPFPAISAKLLLGSPKSTLSSTLPLAPHSPLCRGIDNASAIHREKMK